MRKGFGFHDRHSPFRFNPATLFTGGQQGAWYDPGDITTLFQDSAGTTPVTASGQSVGLMLDKKQGLIFGSELLPTGVLVKIGTATDATYNTATGAGTATRYQAVAGAGE